MASEADVAPKPQSAENPLPTPPESICGASDKSDAPTFPLPPPSQRPNAVLDADKKTPDSWLPRDPRLIRLTGVHPFNVEAPLTELFNEGFLTSPELFYVRNHGPVPQVQDADVPNWEFTVEGMVENPMTVSFKDLLTEYDQLTYPVTFVCAGNRRKEQNVVRKTKGFSWGPAGVSTALWTGIAMLEVLKRAKPLRGARYVCMEGADKLPNGYYGTSVKLNWVMDPNRGIMLAHKMNGESLTPDHGKPLRAVIPGQIGGRSVKWLKKLIITKEPSDNWYHIYDNRVLPTTVSPEESAANKAWWTDERYAIYDLGPNSAIAFPAHDEKLSGSDTSDSYKVRGYAYGGGGRRITRCEVTLDKGKTWRLANIDYAEDRYRDVGERMLFGGKLDMEFRETCFCWCFWDIDISTNELRQAKDIFIRCKDEAMNVQPRDMYWSVLGMMNNPWYRVAIIHEGDHVRFEHPTQPALMPGGWMERIKKAGGDLTDGRWGEPEEGKVTTAKVDTVQQEAVKMTKDGVDRSITIDELRAHDGEEEPWFVVNGEVYDGTAFLQGHPGGASSITSAAGQDSTDEFMAIHSETAKAMMPTYHIGRLDEDGRAALKSDSGADDNAIDESPTFLNPKTWKQATLTSKVSISQDTRIFNFALSFPKQLLGLPTGQHLMLRLPSPVTGDAIIRAYTPISGPTDEGSVAVLVKIYGPTPTHSSGGAMTQALDALDTGATIAVKGPVGHFTYHGAGRCTIHSQDRHISRFVMICAGSGVTPIFQVLRAAATEPAGDKAPKCIVLDGNRAESDILCRAELDAFALKAGKERCEIVHTLTAPGEEWCGLRGRISPELLLEYAGSRGDRDGAKKDEALVLICGPSALEKSVHKELKSLGWRDEDMVLF